MIKLSVSTFGQTAVYRIYTVNREPIRLPYQNFNIQCLVFNKTIYSDESDYNIIICKHGFDQQRLIWYVFCQ